MAIQYFPCLTLWGGEQKNNNKNIVKLWSNPLCKWMYTKILDGVMTRKKKYIVGVPGRELSSLVNTDGACYVGGRWSTA